MHYRALSLAPIHLPLTSTIEGYNHKLLYIIDKPSHASFTMFVHKEDPNGDLAEMCSVEVSFYSGGPSVTKKQEDSSIPPQTAQSVDRFVRYLNLEQLAAIRDSEPPHQIGELRLELP